MLNVQYPLTTWLTLFLTARKDIERIKLVKRENLAL